MGVIVGPNAVALLLACWQAYLARNISSDFSESKYIGIAVFLSWMQVLAVGFPVIFLIDEEDTTTYYFLVILIIFVVCLSMLCLIFGPLLIQHRYIIKQNGRADANIRVSGMIGQQDSHGAGRNRASIVGTDTNGSIDVEYGQTSISSVEKATLQSELAALNASVTNLKRQNGTLEQANDKLKHDVLQLSRAALQHSSSDHSLDLDESLVLSDLETRARD